MISDADFIGFIPSVLFPVSFRGEAHRVTVLFLEVKEAGFEVFGDGFIAFLAIEVVQFLRVGLQVEQLPLIDVIVEMDELVSVGADAVVAFHHVLGRVFIEMVVEGIAPCVRVFSFEEGNKRYALYVIRNFRSGEFEEGRGVVYVLHQLRNVTRLSVICPVCFQSVFSHEAVRESHYERGSHGLLVHEPLVEPAVFSHVESLV